MQNNWIILLLTTDIVLWPIIVSATFADKESVAWLLQVVIPLHQLKAVNTSTSRTNSAEKYIQVISVDNHEFWYMGFVNYDTAVKSLLNALEFSNFRSIWNQAPFCFTLVNLFWILNNYRGWLFYLFHGITHFISLGNKNFYNQYNFYKSEWFLGFKYLIVFIHLFKLNIQVSNLLSLCLTEPEIYFDFEAYFLLRQKQWNAVVHVMPQTQRCWTLWGTSAQYQMLTGLVYLNLEIPIRSPVLFRRLRLIFLERFK